MMEVSDCPVSTSSTNSHSPFPGRWQPGVPTEKLSMSGGNCMFQASYKGNAWEFGTDLSLQNHEHEPAKPLRAAEGSPFSPSPVTVSKLKATVLADTLFVLAQAHRATTDDEAGLLEARQAARPIFLALLNSKSSGFYKE